MSLAKTNATPRVFTVQLGQDDPRKCTARKLCRAGLAKPLYRLSSIPGNAIVLNPRVDHYVLPSDRNSAVRYGIVAVDCSWERADEVFERSLKGIQRRLPMLLPANPVKYAQLAVLSSAEALAAALHITGFKAEAHSLLQQFKWGPHFLTLNHQALDEYGKAKGIDDVRDKESVFFG